MMNFKFFYSFLALICAGAQANTSGKEILSVPCKITESSNKTIENGIFSHINWKGAAKTGDSINLNFRNVSANGVEISFEPISFSTTKLFHIIYPEDSETDGVNWIRSDDKFLKWTNLRMHRKGLELYGIKSQNSVDLRYRSSNNWDGFLIGDVSAPPDFKSIQITVINCKLPLSVWHKTFDHIMKMTKNGAIFKK